MVIFFDYIDIDEFLVLEVSDMVNKLDYSDKVAMFYHFKKSGCDLDNGLHTLRNDSDVLALEDAFVDDFYAFDDPFNGQGGFEPLFGLDDIALLVKVDGIVKGKGKVIEVDVGDKDKVITIDDKIESLDDVEDEEHSSEEEEESDGFVDVENPVEEVEVNMESFDRTDVDNIGYEQNLREFNANNEFEVDIDVMDPDEFESASDEDGLERIRNMKLK
nr:hypothetical protein [Tanacetum cinerariifolium]